MNTYYIDHPVSVHGRDDYQLDGNYDGEGCE